MSEADNTSKDARLHAVTWSAASSTTPTKPGRMQKTVVVEVVNRYRDPVYGKYVKRRKRFHAHDEKQRVPHAGSGRDPREPSALAHQALGCRAPHRAS